MRTGIKMAKLSCANCKDPQGPFNRENGHRLCKNIKACLKRRAKIDKDSYGEEAE
jgi:hypothetical protein